VAVDEQQMVKGDNEHNELMWRKCQPQATTIVTAGLPYCNCGAAMWGGLCRRGRGTMPPRQENGGKASSQMVPISYVYEVISHPRDERWEA